jgi:hypothetical protein
MVNMSVCCFFFCCCCCLVHQRKPCRKCQSITRFHRARPSFLTLNHESKRLRTQTVEESTAFFRKMPPAFCWLVGRRYRCGKRKDLSRYHLEEKAGSRLRSLIRRCDAGRTRRCAEAQGLVMVESRGVVLHPAARWVTTSNKAPRAAAQTYLFLSRSSASKAANNAKVGG